MSRLATHTWFKQLRKTHLSLIVGVLLLLAVFLTYWIGTLRIPYAGNDFLYSADLQTKTNAYNTGEERFKGDVYGLTNYSIRSVSNTDDTVTLRLTQRTTSLNNTALQNSSDTFVIRKSTGEHVGVKQISGKPTYLFAPRNISKDTSFVYRQPGLSVPAVMNYDGEEKIHNVSVYRYTASFTDRIIGDGYEIKPRLRVWIEPTTGWLIKYQETTTKYRYNTATHETGELVGNSTSSFTDASISQNIEYAKQIKYCLEFGRQIAPGVLLFCMLLAVSVGLVRSLRVRSLPIMTTASIVLTAAIANIVGWILHIKPLVQLFMGGVTIGPLVAFCFLCVGLAIIFLYRQTSRRASIMLGATVLVLALLSAAHAIGLVSVDVSNILFQYLYTPQFNASPGLSLFGDIVLCVLGTGIIKAALASQGSALRLAKAMAGIAVMLGLAGLLAKILLLDQVFVVPVIASLSLSGSLLCLFSGLGLMEVLIYRYPITLEKDRTASLFRAFSLPTALTIPLILIGVIAQLQQIKVNTRAQESFSSQTAGIQKSLENSVETYTNTVTGAHALYTASYAVERGEWHNYISALNVATKYPGMQGVGFAGSYTKDQLTSVEKTVRTQGYPNFAVFPAGSRATYAPIIYMEPSANPANQKLLGFDLSTDPVRNETLIKAARSGVATMSGKINLVQETSSDLRGFMLIIPVYQNGAATNTEQERQKALDGYVYAPFEATKFFGSTLANEASNIDVAVYDGFGTDSENILYGQTKTTNDSSDTFTEKRILYANGHPWTIVYSADHNYATSDSDVHLASIILGGGGILYLIGISIFFWLQPLIPRGTKI
jgi:CHASE1-domain containing sensor protein